MRTTITVRHRLTREEVAALLGWHALTELVEDEEFEPPRRFTLRQLDDALRRQVSAAHGEDLFAWHSEAVLGYELDPRTREAIEVWAAEQVARL